MNLNGSGYGQGWSKKYKKRTLLHRLIAEEYLGPCPPGMEVNHINGNKLDNRPENLEYITHQKNMSHAKNTGLIKHGKDLPQTKVSELEVTDIKRLRELNFSYRRIAKTLKHPQGTVDHIIRGDSWIYAEEDLRSQYPNPRPEAICH